MRLLLHAADHHHRLAEICLCRTSGMGQRHKHLSTAPAVFTDAVLDRRVAALEPVLAPEPLKNTLGGMPLLAVLAEVFQQPLVNDLGETVQLWPLDLRHAPIAPSRACKNALPGDGAIPKTS